MIKYFFFDVFEWVIPQLCISFRFRGATIFLHLCFGSPYHVMPKPGKNFSGRFVNDKNIHRCTNRPKSRLLRQFACTRGLQCEGTRHAYQQQRHRQHHQSTADRSVVRLRSRDTQTPARVGGFRGLLALHPGITLVSHSKTTFSVKRCAVRTFGTMTAPSVARWISDMFCWYGFVFILFHHVGGRPILFILPSPHYYFNKHKVLIISRPRLSINDILK